MCGMADSCWRVQTPNHYTHLRTQYMGNSNDFNYVSEFKPQQIIAVWSLNILSGHCYILSASFFKSNSPRREQKSGYGIVSAL